jgi:hypothetical protein
VPEEALNGIERFLGIICSWQCIITKATVGDMRQNQSRRRRGSPLTTTSYCYDGKERTAFSSRRNLCAALECMQSCSAAAGLFVDITTGVAAQLLVASRDSLSKMVANDLSRINNASVAEQSLQQATKQPTCNVCTAASACFSPLHLTASCGKDAFMSVPI